MRMAFIHHIPVGADLCLLESESIWELKKVSQKIVKAESFGRQLHARAMELIVLK